jgi:hypothetical protein
LIGGRLLAALAASGAVLLLAATPAPNAEPPAANALTRAQMEALLPKVALHTAYVVAVNKYGQVTNAKAKTVSKDASFNMQTYGNALQAFIRTPDGKAVSGIYTLTYDYNPKTKKIARSAALVQAGGVNPDTEGAALVMMDAARKEAAAAAAKAKHASPAPHASAAHK